MCKYEVGIIVSTKERDINWVGYVIHVLILRLIHGQYWCKQTLGMMMGNNA